VRLEILSVTDRVRFRVFMVFFGGKENIAVLGNATTVCNIGCVAIAADQSASLPLVKS